MITVRGEYLLHASPISVWPHIFDPASLVRLIPGCQQLEQVSPGEYQGQIRIGIPAVGGTYRTLVKVTEQRQPEYCSFDGEVDGPTGIIKGTVTFALREMPGETTMLEYEGRAMISGALGTLSSRLIENVARTLIKQGLAGFDKELQSR